MLDILLTYHSAFLSGLKTTLELLLLIAVASIPLGILVGVIGTRMMPALGSVVSTLRFLTSSIPVLVLLFWLHYPLQSILHIVVNPFWTTVLALGLVNFILTADIVRREMVLFPNSYREAAATLGLSLWSTARFIELPILMRRIIPQLLSNQGNMLEYTLLASFISVPELFRTAQTINASIYRPVEVYSLLILFFLAILGPLHLAVRKLKKKYAI